METPLEQTLISFQKTLMITHLEEHPEVFEQLIQLALGDKQPFAWRAAWLLSGYMKEDDPRIQPYTNDIIKVIPLKQDGHQRELIKILYMMELGQEHEGYVFDACITIWERINKSPSVRYHALRMIIKIVHNYPELSKEIDFLLQDHYLESLSPGIRRGVEKFARGRNVNK